MQLVSCSSIRAFVPAGVVVVGAFLACAGLAASAEPANYPRAVDPAVKHALIPLPPGAVEPAGWLRDWALATRTASPDTWTKGTRRSGTAGKGFRSKSTGAEPDGMGWPIEQCAYWLDGALRLGFVLHDEALLKKIKARLDPIVDGVNRGTTSFIYWKKDLRPQGFNSWAHSHLGRALVAYYAATGEKRILDALVRVYGDYPVAHGQPRFPRRERAVQCRCDAGNVLLQRRAARAGMCAKAASPRRRRRPDSGMERRAFHEGHAVVTYENLRLPALLYPWTGERRLLQATLNSLAWIDERTCCPTALLGRGVHVGHRRFRKTETCDVAAQIWSLALDVPHPGRRRLRRRARTGVFQCRPGPVARDFQTMCYYQSPNRLRTDSLPCEQPRCPGPQGNRFHPPGCPYVLCCVGAVNRIVPNYVIHMWMAQDDRGLAAALYGPCTVSALVGQRSAREDRLPNRITRSTSRCA